MRKLSFIFLCFTFFFATAKAQELKCNVSVSSRQIQGTNKQVYQTLQNAIYEFMNNTVWTTDVFGMDERIECSMLFNITDQISADEFKATLQIQSSRPVYNSNYSTTMLNIMDEDIHIRYVEFEPLEFSENSYLSNLTSILAYYAYIIIGMDYDSFSPEGGTEFFRMAQTIVNNAQGAGEKGWLGSDSHRHKNRYWLVNNILSDKYEDVRQFMYDYHRQGLDRMDKSVNEARLDVITYLESLRDMFRQKPDLYMYYFYIVLEAKSQELINIFKEGFPDEKNRAEQILSEIDPSNSTKYKAIKGQE